MAPAVALAADFYYLCRVLLPIRVISSPINFDIFLGIKPFACPHEGCEARYTIRPDLKDHIRKVHTRERPFKCSVCDKCFLTGSVYYQHRLIHTNDRRYGCDVSIFLIYNFLIFSS